MDIEECSKRSELYALTCDIASLKKDANLHISKTEVVNRFDAMNKEIHRLVDERPTKLVFRKTLAEYDSRIERTNE